MSNSSYLAGQSPDLRLHYAQWGEGKEISSAQLSAACIISGIIKGFHYIHTHRTLRRVVSSTLDLPFIPYEGLGEMWNLNEEGNAGE